MNDRNIDKLSDSDVVQIQTIFATLIAVASREPNQDFDLLNLYSTGLRDHIDITHNARHESHDETLRCERLNMFQCSKTDPVIALHLFETRDVLVCVQSSLITVWSIKNNFSRFTVITSWRPQKIKLYSAPVFAVTPSYVHIIHILPNSQHHSEENKSSNVSLHYVSMDWNVFGATENILTPLVVYSDQYAIGFRTEFIICSQTQLIIIPRLFLIVRCLNLDPSYKGPLKSTVVQGDTLVIAYDVIDDVTTRTSDHHFDGTICLKGFRLINRVSSTDDEITALCEVFDLPQVLLGTGYRAIYLWHIERCEVLKVIAYPVWIVDSLNHGEILVPVRVTWRNNRIYLHTVFSESERVSLYVVKPSSGEFSSGKGASVAYSFFRQRLCVEETASQDQGMFRSTTSVGFGGKYVISTAEGGRIACAWRINSAAIRVAIEAPTGSIWTACTGSISTACTGSRSKVCVGSRSTACTGSASAACTGSTRSRLSNINSADIKHVGGTCTGSTEKNVTETHDLVVILGSNRGQICVYNSVIPTVTTISSSVCTATSLSTY